MPGWIFVSLWLTQVITALRLSTPARGMGNNNQFMAVGHRMDIERPTVMRHDRPIPRGSGPAAVRSLSRSGFGERPRNQSTTRGSSVVPLPGIHSSRPQNSSTTASSSRTTGASRRVRMQTNQSRPPSVSGIAQRPVARSSAPHRPASHARNSRRAQASSSTTRRIMATPSRRPNVHMCPPLVEQLMNAGDEGEVDEEGRIIFERICKSSGELMSSHTPLPTAQVGGLLQPSEDDGENDEAGAAEPLGEVTQIPGEEEDGPAEQTEEAEGGHSDEEKGVTQVECKLSEHAQKQCEEETVVLVRLDASSSRCAVTAPDLNFDAEMTKELIEGSYNFKAGLSESKPYAVFTQSSIGSPDAISRYSGDLREWSVPNIFRRLKTYENGCPTAFASHALQVQYSLMGSSTNKCGVIPDFLTFNCVINVDTRNAIDGSFQDWRGCKKDTQDEKCHAKNPGQCGSENEEDRFCIMCGTPLGKLAARTLTDIFGIEHDSNWMFEAVTIWNERHTEDNRQLTFTIKERQCPSGRMFSCKSMKYTECT